jgi:hypothetical protein
MPLTRDFKETIMADLRRDRAYRAAYRRRDREHA